MITNMEMIRIPTQARTAEETIMLATKRKKKRQAITMGENATKTTTRYYRAQRTISASFGGPRDRYRPRPRPLPHWQRRKNSTQDSNKKLRRHCRPSAERVVCATFLRTIDKDDAAVERVQQVALGVAATMEPCRPCRRRLHWQKHRRRWYYWWERQTDRFSWRTTAWRMYGERCWTEQQERMPLWSRTTSRRRWRRRHHSR